MIQSRAGQVVYGLAILSLGMTGLYSFTKPMLESWSRYDSSAPSIYDLDPAFITESDIRGVYPNVVKRGQGSIYPWGEKAAFVETSTSRVEEIVVGDFKRRCLTSEKERIIKRGETTLRIIQFGEGETYRSCMERSKS